MNGVFLIQTLCGCPDPANEAVGSVAELPDTDMCQAAHHWELRGLRRGSQECNVSSDLLIHNPDRDDHKFLKCRPAGICTKYQFLTSKIVRMLKKDWFCFQNKTG